MKKIYCLLILLLINYHTFASLKCAGYEDVNENEWYCTSLQNLQEFEILGKQKYFRPSDKLNRAEALKIIYGITGKNIPSYTKNFFDIKGDNWYKKYFYNAYSEKIIKPENQKFKPNEFISKSEFIVLILVILDIDHENTSCDLNNTIKQDINSNFVNTEKYKNYLCKAQELNISNKSFDDNTIDRATMTKIIYNLLFY